MLLELDAPASTAQPDTAIPVAKSQPLSQRQLDEEEAADFIRRNVLEKDANFNDG